jgi:hypothetical protein
LTTCRLVAKVRIKHRNIINRGHNEMSDESTLKNTYPDSKCENVLVPALI